MSDTKDLLLRTKSASRTLQSISDEKRVEVLKHLSEAIMSHIPYLLSANAGDLSRMDPSNPLYDRLKLDESRLSSIATDMLSVSSLPSPLGRILSDTIRPNGLRIRKVTVPYGVIGIIYEARPNVTFDVFSLCFKSGNACILKGGRDASGSNGAAVRLIKEVLENDGISPDVINMVDATHEAAGELLSATGLVDLVIPRGGRKLIDFVRNNAKVPCIETGAGVVDAYFDADGNLETGKRVICNSKTRRVSVCNALDCLIVHSARLSDLPELLSTMRNVTIFADERAYASLEGNYPADLLEHASLDSFGTEFMSYKLAVKTVDSIDEALEHISIYGSGHSETIVTENDEAATRFQMEVDAACVYVNAPTSFSDGAQFGLGAEIGISTQKLGARGPMGLEELATYKWLVNGNGQVRE
ncbi:MAG: glutamate-5-semialdehyde dehydrogenase [Bacteroidales bacterium]|nr:glutamate-5-semialdehyde dehydrogenase [Bacteroidales bacterium]